MTADKESTTRLFRRMLDELSGTTVTIEVLIARLEHRSFGAVIILLAAIGLLPGISIAAGFAILVLAAQLIRGLHSPRLPRSLMQRQIKVERLRQTMQRPINWLEKIEHVIRPRLLPLSKPVAVRTTGVVIAILAVIMITPMPLSNLLPAIALLLLSIGLLETDGIMIILGILASLFALTVGVVMIELLIMLAQHALSQF